LIFSQPQAHKVDHIKHHPMVALNFNSTDTGGDVVVLLGEAEIETSPVSAEEMEVYLEKYKRGLVEINMTEDEFNASYSTTIRVKPSHLRGH
jgi:PPOX class probable F420-dependent enzyme